MSDDREEDEDAIEAIEVRRNPWLLGLATSPFAMAATMVLGGAFGSGPFILCIAPLTAVLGIATTYFTWRRNPLPQRVPVRLRADRDRLVVDDVASGRSQMVAVKQMVRGVRIGGPERAVIRITRRWGRNLVLEVAPSVEPPLLTRLGLDVRQTAASFRAMSRIHAGPRTMRYAAGGAIASSAGIVLTAMLLPHPAPLVLLPFVLLAPVALALVPSHVEVGADGVLIRWLGTRRFIGHADILGVSVTSHSPRQTYAMTIVWIGTRTREPICIPIPGADQWSDDAETLSSRIRDARAAWEASQGRPPIPLLRAGREHLAWVSELRRQEAADLRSTAMPRAELWRVVEDVSAASIDRAAAALALGRELSNTDRARLSTAASATVQPQLRVVLERASVAEDDEVIVHLKALERTRS